MIFSVGLDDDDASSWEGRIRQTESIKCHLATVNG